MRARTRMWRTMVAIILGGNLCGGMWQRPQFVRKRFSPSTRTALFSAAVGGRAVGGAATEGTTTDETAPGERTTGEGVPLAADEFWPDSAATIAARIRTTARIRISNLLVQGEMRTDKSPLQSRYWHCLRN